MSFRNPSPKKLFVHEPTQNSVVFVTGSSFSMSARPKQLIEMTESDETSATQAPGISSDSRRLAIRVFNSSMVWRALDSPEEAAEGSGQETTRTKNSATRKGEGRLRYASTLARGALDNHRLTRGSEWIAGVAIRTVSVFLLGIFFSFFSAEIDYNMS